jgi:putative FmdB family regulatory protein|tara:strand:+ start:1715 stop:1975 length:261 start_codon:yes stop_codon:yes gene_type:complete
MPLYDYKCKTCNHTWEEQQTIESRNVPRYNPCPECGTSDNIILLIGKPSIGDVVRMGIKKPDNHVVDRLKEVQKTMPNANIKSRYI